MQLGNISDGGAWCCVLRVLLCDRYFMERKVILLLELFWCEILHTMMLLLCWRGSLNASRITNHELGYAELGSWDLTIPFLCYLEVVLSTLSQAFERGIQADLLFWISVDQVPGTQQNGSRTLHAHNACYTWPWIPWKGLPHPDHLQRLQHQQLLRTMGCVSYKHTRIEHSYAEQKNVQQQHYLHLWWFLLFHKCYCIREKLAYFSYTTKIC